MLSPDVRVTGFSAEEWLRLAELFRAPPKSSVAAPEARGGVVAVTTEGRLRKLVATRSGRIDLNGQPWPVPLAELARRNDARWAVELTTGSLERLADRYGSRLRRSDTYLSQMLALLQVLRELETEGGIQLWPWPIAEWPIPTERAVVRVLDALCPSGRAAVIGVFERGELYTCVAARRGKLGFDALFGPGELRDEMGLLSGDWQRDYRFLAQSAERALGPLALGCFGELYTFQELAKSSAPGAWAAAVAARDIILSPVSPALALPLGLDAGRALWSSMRGVADRFGATEWLGALGARGSWSPTLERGFSLFEADVKAWLGFDPLRLLTRLLAPPS